MMKTYYHDRLGKVTLCHKCHWEERSHTTLASATKTQGPCAKCGRKS